MVSFRSKSYDPATAVYLMIYPPEDKIAEMTEIAAGIRRSYGLIGAPSRKHLHMTLGPLGPLGKVIYWGLSSVIEACESAARQTTPLDIELDRVVSSGGPVLLSKTGGNEALFQFHHRLRTEMMRRRSKFADGYKFRPHVTVLHNGKDL